MYVNLLNRISEIQILKRDANRLFEVRVSLRHCLRAWPIDSAINIYFLWKPDTAMSFFVLAPCLKATKRANQITKGTVSVPIESNSKESYLWIKMHFSWTGPKRIQGPVKEQVFKENVFKKIVLPKNELFYTFLQFWMVFSNVCEKLLYWYKISITHLSLIEGWNVNMSMHINLLQNISLSFEYNQHVLFICVSTSFNTLLFEWSNDGILG